LKGLFGNLNETAPVIFWVIFVDKKLPVKNTNASNQAPSKAAMYVRMSTDHQKYSTHNQEDAIRKYAANRNIEIVATYADEGKSGLKIDGRQALKNLINDVQNGEAVFKIILVLDITRWGRFQDADESAYYEYICRNAKMMAAQVQQLLKALNVQWRPNIAENFLKRCLWANVD